MFTIKKPYILYLSLSILFIGLISCEKNVTVKVPEGKEEIVVEGYIEPGQAPLVIISKTLPFFGEINTNDVIQNLITNATVIINDGSVTDTLLGFSGLYTSATLRGQVGKRYALTVLANGKTLTAVTTIPNPVSFDSVWWKVDGERDSLGFCWAKLSDPDTLGNCYRIFTQRINRYTYGTEVGKIKDSTIIAVGGGASFEDKFINGRSFDLSFARGSFNFSEREDDNNEERFFFKRGDTIVVKFCSIDRDHFNFWRKEESQVSSNGNPFGSPQPVVGNINGGLGVWGGYSPVFDTIIAR